MSTETIRPVPQPDTARTSSIRRMLSVALRLAAVPVVAAGLGLTLTGVASAAVGPYTVQSSTGVNERTGPSTSDAEVGWLGNGTKVMINCQAAGGAYATAGNPASDDIWDQLANGDYVADYWLSTPAVGTFSSGIPRCGATTGLGSYGTTVGDNPFPAGQCTYGADQLAHNEMVTDPSEYPAGRDYIDVWGNADQWASSAASNGWTVVSTPKVDSIVVFQPGVQGADPAYGHVAWVTNVYSNGTFRIEEMNGPAGPGVYDFRTVSDASGESFILIPPFS